MPAPCWGHPGQHTPEDKVGATVPSRPRCPPGPCSQAPSAAASCPVLHPASSTDCPSTMWPTDTPEWLEVKTPAPASLRKHRVARHRGEHSSPLPPAGWSPPLPGLAPSPFSFRESSFWPGRKGPGPLTALVWPAAGSPRRPPVMVHVPALPLVAVACPSGLDMWSTLGRM